MKQNVPTVKIELTEKECELIANLITQINVNPLASDAHDMIDLIANLVKKLSING